eukprot:CAMPEP_0174313922 /NCGR_PEP_ID=MMETSP0810-20121108/5309_1 /TAXON_ID=73025 ORGANISM="Eutreptiella gymnastica-like, Strain CCMP1594" /NCGR_SAMPLE_ID=MMETSP0810 /ASSEMBLY_ACC=CAM_ASM_000659 /LENGTH=49 /DNA_ID= /DNA_START= /DNA_END= /DNA_ORIENTATION=
MRRGRGRGTEVRKGKAVASNSLHGHRHETHGSPGTHVVGGQRMGVGGGG